MPSRRPARTRARSRSTARSRRPAAAVHTLKPEPVSVGVSIRKLEADEKVTGRALYVDDLIVPGVLHGRTVRSTVARGIIRKIEKDPAFDWSDVVIADHKDIPGENVVLLIEDDQPLLAAEEIHHADEPILLVAHEDPERAEAARMAIRIEVEPLPAVFSVDEALEKRVLIH